MSPRIIHLLLPGRDRRHYIRELRAAEQAHRDLPAKVEEAYSAAHAVACHEWTFGSSSAGRRENYVGGGKSANCINNKVKQKELLSGVGSERRSAP
jgi:hypothetical protein